MKDYSEFINEVDATDVRKANDRAKKTKARVTKAKDGLQQAKDRKSAFDKNAKSMMDNHNKKTADSLAASNAKIAALKAKAAELAAKRKAR